MSVSVNPPKTPVTAKSKGLANATLPNVCKMPGPPPPFVPTPLPNLGKSGDRPKGYTKSVVVEGAAVAIQGASFGSVGDAASKATGGGVLSANTHGPCKFISPGSLNVKFEGKSVHLLSDMTTNNGAASGAPANSATMAGLMQLIAAARNTENTNTACPGGGDHQWVQITPSGAVSLDEKIEALESHDSSGPRFEGQAARHNRDVAGDLTDSEHLSGADEDIRMMCNINGCSYNTNPGSCPEHDHISTDPATGEHGIVEVKSNTQFDVRAARQMGRNFQAVGQGVASSLSMKYPKGPRHAWAVKRARDVAAALGRAVRIVRV